MHAASNPALAGPVLLATSGAELSDAPAIAAQRLAQRLGLPLHVVTVVEPSNYEPGLERLALLDQLSQERAQAQRDTVCRYLDSIAANGLPVTIEVRHGRISREIAAAARQRDATVIVLGSTLRHRLVRALTGVRASQVMRLAGTPVLAVQLDFDSLPKRAIAAVDFASPSIRAAFTALLMLADGAKLTLLHVHDGTNDDWDRHIDDAFARLLERLRRVAPSGVSIERLDASGTVADTILSIAEQQSADLIAVGTHGPRLAERLFVGTVATRVLHLSRVTVVATAAPPSANPLEWELDANETAWSDRPDEWPSELDAFSRRNANRLVSLNVYSMDIGAQVEVREFTLQGVVYDSHDGHISLMLALEPNGRTHLTRVIPFPRSIAIRTGGRAGDAALAIRHHRGQTVLRFAE